MPVRKKSIVLVSGAFILSGLLLGAMEWNLLAVNVDVYPLLLFSLLLMAALLTVILVILIGSCNSLSALAESYRQRLAEASSELDSTRGTLEERVERRTFEISLANASLNREIAERIQAEAETRKIKRQMELILDSAGEGIFGLDAAGNVAFVNKAASLMLGWEQDDLLGKSHHDLVHHTHADGGEYPVEDCPIHQAYLDGKVHFGSDEVFWAKDGSSFQVEYISTPIVENKKLAGAVVVFRDLNTFT